MMPAQLVLRSDPSPSPRMAERPALSGDTATDAAAGSGGFSPGDAALYLGRSHFGAVASVAAVEEGKGLEVFVEPVPPCTGVGRRILQGVFGGRYEHPPAVARKVGLNTRALSQLTGPLWVAPTKDCGRFDRIDIGLNLKSGNKGLCVADYTRPQKEGPDVEKGGRPGGWEFSQQAIKLLQEYKQYHSWVFNAIMADPDNGFEGLQLDEVLKHVPEMQRLPMLMATKAWIKSTPAARRPLVSKFSRIAAEEAVKALYAAMGAPPSKLTPVALEAVSPLLLMLPVRAGEVLDLYAGGDFDLGDRVVMVGDSGSPPFGMRGYIVAVHGEAAEIMFDADFAGATDLHGVLPERRGIMLPTAQLVNLSHPPAMPQLGTAAPTQVRADKKGKATLPKGFEEAWTPDNAGGKSVLAMAAALLPGRGGAGAPPPQAQPKGPRMPVQGSKGFEPGMGRGRGGLAGGRGGGVGAGAGASAAAAAALAGPPARVLGAPPSPGAGGVGAGGLMAMLEGAAANADGGNDLKAMLGIGGGGASRVPAPVPVPAPPQGADVLKSMLGIGGGGAPAPAAAPAPMTLEQLEQMMSAMIPAAPQAGGKKAAPGGNSGGGGMPAPKAASAPKAVLQRPPPQQQPRQQQPMMTPPIKGPAPPGPPPGPMDPAAFWDMLSGGGNAPAGGAPPAMRPMPVPSVVSMPPMPVPAAKAMPPMPKPMPVPMPAPVRAAAPAPAPMRVATVPPPMPTSATSLAYLEAAAAAAPAPAALAVGLCQLNAVYP
jgi:hypothetical protein